jgi:hypothetical protein
MLFSWVNVPTFGGTGTSSFSLAINADSSVSFSYGNMDTVVAQRALGGVTGGYPLTTGAETTVTLGSLPMPIGTGVPAVFQAFAAGPFPYANGTLSFDAAHAALSSPMPLGDEAACEVVFPTSAAFPFGGTTYGSAFFNSNGYVGLGFNTIDYPGWYYTVSDTQAFLGLFPRIAPFWIDLAPNPGGITEGSFTVQSTANSVSFSWTSVPELGPSPGANTASVTLGPSEAIVMNFGPASMTQPHTGFSTGGGKTMGTELSTNLSALSSPIGRGTDTAIFESFTMFDLANTSISFTGASRILYQDPILSPGIVRVALGAAPGDGGLGYVAALSLGSVPGIPVTGCANVPLNFDPLFVLSLSGLMLNNTGVLDGWGQKDGFPAVPPASPMVVLVPSGLAGLGLTAWMSFVTYPSGGGCVFRTIAGAVPFRIP